jgi:hypothetical protein
VYNEVMITNLMVQVNQTEVLYGSKLLLSYQARYRKTS